MTADDVFCVMPSSQSTASFLYLLSPREFILIAGSLPLLPQRLMVSEETRRISATSFTVNKSGRFSSDNLSAILLQCIS